MNFLKAQSETHILIFLTNFRKKIMGCILNEKEISNHCNYIIIFNKCLCLISIIYNSRFFKKGEVSEGNLIQSIMKEKLSLSESQAAEIGDLRASFEDELENAGIKLNEKQIELFNAVRSDYPDTCLISNLIDQISLLQAYLQKEAVKRMIREKSLLNPIQREKYFSMFDERFAPGRPFGGRGKGYIEGRGRRGGRGPRWLRDNNF